MEYIVSFMKIKTGYYAAPNSERKFKVHIIKGKNSLCGYKPGKTMIFRWCGNGAVIPYVNCLKCRQVIEKKQLLPLDSLQRM